MLDSSGRNLRSRYPVVRNICLHHLSRHPFTLTEQTYRKNMAGDSVTYTVLFHQPSEAVVLWSTQVTLEQARLKQISEMSCGKEFLPCNTRNWILAALSALRFDLLLP